jgi:hypothetical protein
MGQTSYIYINEMKMWQAMQDSYTSRDVDKKNLNELGVVSKPQNKTYETLGCALN